MRKRKWFISVVLPMVLIGGIAGGVMVAVDDGSGNVDQQNQLTDRCQGPLDRVCAVYQENTGVAIDSEQLGEGFGPSCGRCPGSDASGVAPIR